MIVPARTRCPSPHLTPRRLPPLSRPLRELPMPFLCAISLRPLLNLGHPEPRQALPMAGLAAIPHLGLVLEDDDLLAAGLLDQLGQHLRARHRRTSERGLAVAADQQHAIELNRLASAPVESLD